MEFNLVVPGIELVGTTVKTLTIGNNIVDVEKEAKRSFGLNINEPHFEETNDVFFAQMTIDFEIDIEQSENQNCQIQLSLDISKVSYSERSSGNYRYSQGKNRNDYFKCFQQWKNCYPIYQCDRLL